MVTFKRKKKVLKRFHLTFSSFVRGSLFVSFVDTNSPQGQLFCIASGMPCYSFGFLISLEAPLSSCTTPALQTARYGLLEVSIEESHAKLCKRVRLNLIGKPTLTRMHELQYLTWLLFLKFAIRILESFNVKLMNLFFFFSFLKITFF